MAGVMGQPQLPPDERGVPCKWENEDDGACMLDGCGCEICENYEAKNNGGKFGA